MIQKKYPLADSTMIILYILVVYLISWIFVTYIPNRTLTDLSIFLPGIVALLFMWWQNLEIKSLFRWGDTKNVFIGFVAPLMIMLFSMAVCSIFSFAHYSFPPWVLNWYQESLLAGLIEILFIILFTPLVLGCVFSLGEEIGWRGYLLKQLKDVVPHFLVRALSVGIIWGAWHVPTYYHLGFSMPQLGIFLINVCLISVFYTYLFEKQNSIWPTVIAHTYHTTFINYVLPFVTSSEENIPLLFGDAGLLVTAGYAVIALIIYIQKMRD